MNQVCADHLIREGVIERHEFASKSHLLTRKKIKRDQASRGKEEKEKDGGGGGGGGENGENEMEKEKGKENG